MHHFSSYSVASPMPVGENKFGIIATGNIAIKYGVMVSLRQSAITLADTLYGGKPRFEALRALAAAAANANGSPVLAEEAHPDGHLFARIGKDTVAPSVVQMPAREPCGSYTVTREAIPWRPRSRHYELHACYRVCRRRRL
ncbi:NADH:flavin oxidoreductase/NADH oxidase-like protein [Apiospora aurea]|uniref:NADH:flavin oxidoreductase/NADH oxidase-like protein n=1 Tax=Apiospora aurea TaxID=335848 RepID=A0ABR1QGY7_9PEZI